MKISFSVLFIFLITGVVLAHSFSEIPPNHWSIEVMSNLQAKYSSQSPIQNLPTKKSALTRFECAQRIFAILQIVADKIAFQQEIPAEDINQLEKLVKEFLIEIRNQKPKKEILIQIFGENHEIVYWLTDPEIKFSSKDQPISISGEYTLSYEVYFPPDPQHNKIKPHWKDELDLEINLKFGPSVKGTLKLSVPDVWITPQPNY